MRNLKIVAQTMDPQNAQVGDCRIDPKIVHNSTHLLQGNNTFINEHSKQARRFLSSFGTVSSDITMSKGVNSLNKQNLVDLLPVNTEEYIIETFQIRDALFG